MMMLKPIEVKGPVQDYIANKYMRQDFLFLFILKATGVVICLGSCGNCLNLQLSPPYSRASGLCTVPPSCPQDLNVRSH